MRYTCTDPIFRFFKGLDQVPEASVGEFTHHARKMAQYCQETMKRGGLRQYSLKREIQPYGAQMWVNVIDNGLGSPLILGKIELMRENPVIKPELFLPGLFLVGTYDSTDNSDWFMIEANPEVMPSGAAVVASEGTWRIFERPNYIPAGSYYGGDSWCTTPVNMPDTTNVTSAISITNDDGTRRSYICTYAGQIFPIQPEFGPFDGPRYWFTDGTLMAAASRDFRALVDGKWESIAYDGDSALVPRYFDAHGTNGLYYNNGGLEVWELSAGSVALVEETASGTPPPEEYLECGVDPAFICNYDPGSPPLIPNPTETHIRQNDSLEAGWQITNGELLKFTNESNYVIDYIVSKEPYNASFDFVYTYNLFRSQYNKVSFDGYAVSEYTDTEKVHVEVAYAFVEPFAYQSVVGPSYRFVEPCYSEYDYNIPTIGLHKRRREFGVDGVPTTGTVLKCICPKAFGTKILTYDHIVYINDALFPTALETNCENEEACDTWFASEITPLTADNTCIFICATHGLSNNKDVIEAYEVWGLYNGELTDLTAIFDKVWGERIWDSLNPNLTAIALRSLASQAVSFVPNAVIPEIPMQTWE